MTKAEMIEYNNYLASCTQAQLSKDFAKENASGRKDRAMLILNEAGRRGIGV